MGRKGGKLSPALDFFLLTSLMLWGLKFREFISPEISAIAFLAVTLILIVLRVVGSNAFQSRIQPWKIIGSLAFFALSAAGWDPKLAIPLAILILCGPLMAFGIYIMAAGHFRRGPKPSLSTLVFILVGTLFILSLLKSGTPEELGLAFAQWLKATFP